MGKKVNQIRIYPISSFEYPTEEYAKICIANGFENYTSFGNLGNDRAHLDLVGRTLFLFQYNGNIIAKANVYLIDKFWGTAYYTDEIAVIDESITATDIRNIWREFKKFNSAAQKGPIEHLPATLELFDERNKVKTLNLSENETCCFDRTEGKRIEYYVKKYERNPKYREQAIKIHGCTCQICGFDFKKVYGKLGERYIEVHHKKPLFSLDEEIVPNPEIDMICVCSNCHRMLHRHRNSIITPEELTVILNNQRRRKNNQAK